MLNEKEIKVLDAINSFINNYHYSPTIRELNIILNYKSTRTIYNYLLKLKEKGFIQIISNKKRNIVLNNNYNTNLTIINRNKKINLSITNNQLIFQMNNDFFTKYLIKKNDLLIIDVKKKPQNNQLGLFLINNIKRIMIYHYQSGYHILEDNEKEVLSKVIIIGKVVGVYRKIK